MDIHINEEPLPGIGRRYELRVEEDRNLSVIVQHDGARHIVVLREGADEPEPAVRLSLEQAVALAAILMGARIAVGTAEDDRIGADAVVIKTLTLKPSSPVVGRLVKDVPLPADCDAAVLAVISDTTPELVEDHTIRPCQPGDRIVVAARHRYLSAVVQRLLG